jgi:hypothetical protein
MYTPIQKQSPEPSAADIIRMATEAHEDMLANSANGGEIFIMFQDRERNTQVVPFISPLSDEEQIASDAETCYAEVKEALEEEHWRPICLSVLPYGEPKIVSLRNDPTMEDQVFMDALVIHDDESEPVN